MNTNQKLGIGSFLAVVGALGIVLFPVLNEGRLHGPWAFILGFLFGVSAGVGVALSISGLWERRTR